MRGQSSGYSFCLCKWSSFNIKRFSNSEIVEDRLPIIYFFWFISFYMLQNVFFCFSRVCVWQKAACWKMKVSPLISFLKIRRTWDSCLHIFVAICLLNASICSASSWCLKELRLGKHEMLKYAKILRQSQVTLPKCFLVTEGPLQEFPTVSSEISFKLKNKNKNARITIYYQTLANTSLLWLLFTLRET